MNLHTCPPHPHLRDELFPPLPQREEKVMILTGLALNQ